MNNSAAGNRRFADMTGRGNIHNFWFAIRSSPTRHNPIPFLFLTSTSGFQTNNDPGPNMNNNPAPISALNIMIQEEKRISKNQLSNICQTK